MNDTTTTPPPTWRAWVRDCNGGWRLIAEGTSYDTVTDAMLRADCAPCCERVITAGRGDPNTLLKRPRRRF